MRQILLSFTAKILLVRFGTYQIDWWFTSILYVRQKSTGLRNWWCRLRDADGETNREVPSV